MKVGRLLRMGLPEVVTRGRQELWKSFERIGLAEVTPAPPLGVFAQLAPVPDLDPIRERAEAGDAKGAAAALFERFRSAVPPRFFAGASRAMTPGLLDARLTADDRLLANADAVTEGRFDFLGYRRLFYGDPVDWHLDPNSRRRAPVVHWTRIDPLDPRQVGDSKVIWELNRHQWLVRLGQAYTLTRDERYAETFRARVLEWLDANPAGFGINWASSLEIALRLIAWSWALVLFRSARACSPELFAAMLGSIVAHAAHVERYLSHYFSPNTHLTGEALGLFYAGTVFPELRAAGRWRALGHRILVHESERQILPDGVHFERATCYQRYTAEIYLHFTLLAARNGIEVPAAVTERLGRLLDVLLYLRRPDGSLPQIGDADGGWLLPLCTRPPDDLRGVMATAAAVFGRGDYAWAAAGPAPEPLWLVGAVDQPAVPAAPAAPPSRAFPDGGFVVLRSAWDRRAHQLILDTGALGCPVSAGHGHADLLAVQCAVFGEPYVVDPGTYCYTPEPEWRRHFRSTAAHSTVTVDGVGQAESRGPFAWDAMPAARLVQWRTSDALEVAEGEHHAYGRLREPVVHRRRVLWVRRRYWVVVDDLGGAGEHAVELRFQFAPMELTVTPALWARARGARGHGMLVRPFTTVRLKGDVVAGETAPIQGWVSPDYGVRRPAPALVYSAVARMPLRIATLLLPIEDPAAEPPPVSLLLGEGPGPVALRLEDRDETVRFGEREQLVAGDRGPGAA